MKILKILAIFYVFLIVFLLNNAFERRSCISSILVKSVVIKRGNAVVEIPGCSARLGEVELSYNEFKSVQLLKKNLYNFEEILSVNRMPWRPASLEIKLNTEDSRPVSEIIMRSWIEGMAGGTAKQDEFYKQIVTDILLNILWADKRHQDVRALDWLEYVYSEKDMCKTRWNPYVRKEICEVISDTKVASLQKPSVWSLRPLVGKKIIDFYDDIPMSEKIKFIRYLGQMVVTETKMPSYEKLDLSNIEEVYKNILNHLVKGFGVQLDGQLNVDHVILSPELLTLDLKSILKGRNTVTEIKSGYFNNHNNTIINSERVIAKNTVVDTKTADELNLSNFYSDYVTLVARSGGYPIFVKVHTPSLRLYSQITGQQFGQLDWVRNSARLQNILGWNPVEVY